MTFPHNREPLRSKPLRGERMELEARIASLEAECEKLREEVLRLAKELDHQDGKA